MKSCKLVLLGCGEVGKKRLSASKNIDGVDIVALYDINCDAAKQLAGQTSLKILQNFEDIESISYDGVIIATPNDSHLTLCQYFIEHEKYILCESPLVKSIEQLEILRRLDEDKLSLITPAQPILFHPAVNELRSHLKANTLGKLYTVKISLGHNQESTKFSWKSDSAISGGGALIDLGPNIISLVNLFGNVRDYSVHTKNFSNESSISDYAFGHFELEDGALIHFEADWNKWSNNQSIILEGERGILKVPLQGSHLLLTTKDAQVIRIPISSQDDSLESEIHEFKNRIIEKDRCLKDLSKFIYLLPAIMRKAK